MFRESQDLAQKELISLFYEMATHVKNPYVNCEIFSDNIAKRLKQKDIDYRALVVRAGFQCKENVDEIEQTGICKERRHSYDGIYAAHFSEMRYIHVIDDMALNPLYWLNHYVENNPALVFYDADKLTLQDEDMKRYSFNTEPLDALVGILEFRII